MGSDSGLGTRASGLSFWLRRSKLEKAAALVLLASLFVDGTGYDRAHPVLAGILHLATAGCFLALLVRYLRSLLTIAIWRLRNRLLIAYLFIAVVPILLIGAMMAISTYIFYGLVATYMASSEVDKLQDELALSARAVALDLEHGIPGDPRSILMSHLPPILRGVQPEVRLMTAAEAQPRLQNQETREFEGLVRTEEGFDLRNIVPTGNRYLVISVGLNRAIAAWIQPDIGAVSLADQTRLGQGGARRAALAVSTPPAAADWSDFEVKLVFSMKVSDWETGKVADDEHAAVLQVATRRSRLNGLLFGHLGRFSQVPFTILIVAGVLFLLIEIGSLVVGVRLTSSITGAVNDLYEGTQRINRGDFSYRIPVRARDQLSALADSFNTMTVSLERLIDESKEKERLQSELEIASQVQRQLFPKQLPNLRGLELAGVCRPARIVSGDYYDFVAFDESHLALAIGDIAGKGISAALIMAGIQSALHAQLHQGRGMAAGGHDGEPGGAVGMSPERLVARLNRQLYESTAASTFATFCYCIYDDSDGRLTYTNAGHLPPLVVSADDTRWLTKGGLVLGIRPEAVYEQESIMLKPGDLFVAYTDGITEPENSYGGEFGEDRLLEVILKVRDRSPREVAAAILQAVDQWSDSPEAYDDMTLLVARRL